MTNTIYLVMAKCCGIPSVRGIFRDLIRAQEFIKRNKEREGIELYNDPTIEEWTIV